MPRARNGDVELEYDIFGDSEDPCLLLVAGQGSPLLMWPEEFCMSLVDRGFQVIRYDNRDSGLSTIMDGPYSLGDMAADGIAVLDDVSVDAAHVVGVSLGGMIAQVMAGEYPDRVATLTSISSTTGNWDHGVPSDEALAVLVGSVPTEREAYLDAQVANRLVWASPEWGTDREEIRAYFAAALDRAPYQPAGATRQLDAILSTPIRDDELAELSMPVLVIHGDSDTLIDPSGGRHTADVIDHAELLMIEGMGHDLPVQVWPQIISAITRMVALSA